MSLDSGLGTVPFMGLRLLVGKSSNVAEWMTERARREKTTVAYINFYNWWLATRREPAQVPKDTYTLVFEGIGMKIAACILGNGWLPDANGTDMYPLVMERAAKLQLRIFLLGGTPDVLERTVESIRFGYPRVCVCGAHQGYFAENEVAGIIQRIQRSGADMLVISRGSGLHADFIARYRQAFNVGLIWNTGGLFDFVSGRIPRAPKWMRSLRLEWCFRLLVEPHRKAHRYLFIFPVFLAQVLRSRIQPAFRLEKGSVQPETRESYE